MTADEGVMRTPSLRLRVVAAGVAVVAVVLVALDVFLYLSLRSSLRDNLDALLADRARLVRIEAHMAQGPADLAQRLTQLGLRATVRGPDGRTYRAAPPSPRLGTNLPVEDRDGSQPRIFRTVRLPDGTTVVVDARRAGVDNALRRLLVLEVAGTTAALALAAALLVRVAQVALRPLEVMAAMARRTATGQRGERLCPDRPHTRVGQLAAAYDAMLDALEAALHEAQEARARSEQLEERTQRIVDTASDAFVSVDASGAIVGWNAQAERTFGWSRQEVSGRQLADVIAPPNGHSEYQGRIQGLLSTGERRARGRRTETTARRRDGTVFAAEVTEWATGEGDERAVHLFVHDVTERREAEQERARLAAIVESSDDAILSKTLDGTVTSWNRGAERLYGYTAEEMVGRPITTIVPRELHGEVERFLEMVRRGGRVPPHETVRIPKHGPPVEVSLAISPIRDRDGNVIGASAIARDLTEQRWLASTLDSTLVALQAALQEARAAEARSRRFLADAAHQLRTPIAGVRASAETLLRGPSQPERDRLMANMVREASRASRLIADLLKIARLDQGEALAPTACDLVALCEDEAGRARALAPDLAISVDAGGLHGRLELDPDATRDILANLLENARRHARSRVDVVVRGGEDGVEVRVVDDGPGLAPGTEERVFERFVTLDAQGGSGLGLPIARGRARAQGGELAYEDAAFVVRLPSRVVASDELATRGS